METQPDSLTGIPLPLRWLPAAGLLLWLCAAGTALTYVASR